MTQKIRITPIDHKEKSGSSMEWAVEIVLSHNSSANKRPMPQMVELT